MTWLGDVWRAFAGKQPARPAECATNLTYRHPCWDAYRTMKKAELRAEFQRFHDGLPIWLDELAREVRGDPRFAAWPADYAPESLQMLGDWLDAQLRFRPHTAAELAEIERSLRPPSRLEDVIGDGLRFTDAARTAAECAGMYYGQVLIANDRSLHWDVQLHGGKTIWCYGHPVIAGEGWIAFNPMQVAVNIASSKHARGEPTGARLMELYRTHRRAYPGPGR